MATVHEGRQSALAHPKTARQSDFNARYSPTANRRNIVAGGKNHSAPTPTTKSEQVSRGIQKHAHGRRSHQSEYNLAERFATQIDTYRKKLETSVNQSLSDIHAAHIQQVDHLSNQFEARLAILYDSEKPLYLSFGSEVLSIPRKPNELDSDPDLQPEKISLHNRFVHFQQQLNKHHKIIDDLVDEWNETQVEIIALAAEILGADKMRIADDVRRGEGSVAGSDLGKAMNISRTTHDKAEAEFNSMLNNVEDLERRVKDLTSETKDTMKQQQKEISLAKQKKLKKLNDAVKDLADDD